MKMAADLIRKGCEFDTFDELQRCVTDLENRESLSLYIRDSRTIDAARKKGIKRYVNPGLKYYSIKFACYHGGRKFKSRASTGSRPNQSTFKMDCPYSIHAVVDATGNKLVIDAVVLNHNHEVWKEIVDNLPKKRRLDEAEQQDVLHMLSMHCNKWLIQQHVMRQTGKKITLKDIHNLASTLHGHNDLKEIEQSLADCTGEHSMTNDGSSYESFLVGCSDPCAGSESTTCAGLSSEFPAMSTESFLAGCSEARQSQVCMADESIVKYQMAKQVARTAVRARKTGRMKNPQSVRMRLTKSYPCQVCGKQFRLNARLKAHSALHILTNNPSKFVHLPDNLLYQCEWCGQSFTRYESMTMHIRTQCEEYADIHADFKTPATETQTQEVEHKCPKCGICFKDQQHLLNHVNSRRCRSLRAAAATAADNIKKQMSVSGNDESMDPALTHNTGKSVRSSPRIKSHNLSDIIKRESGNSSESDIDAKSDNHAMQECRKPRECPLCRKVLSCQYTLDRHMAIHSGSKPYICDNCGRTYIYRTNLRRHEHACRKRNRDSQYSSVYTDANTKAKKCHRCGKIKHPTFTHRCSVPRLSIPYEGVSLEKGARSGDAEIAEGKANTNSSDAIHDDGLQNEELSTSPKKSAASVSEVQSESDKLKRVVSNSKSMVNNSKASVRVARNKKLGGANCCVVVPVDLNLSGRKTKVRNTTSDLTAATLSDIAKQSQRSEHCGISESTVDSNETAVYVANDKELCGTSRHVAVPVRFSMPNVKVQVISKPPFANKLASPAENEKTTNHSASSSAANLDRSNNSKHTSIFEPVSSARHLAAEFRPKMSDDATEWSNRTMSCTNHCGPSRTLTPNVDLKRPTSGDFEPSVDKKHFKFSCLSCDKQFTSNSALYEHSCSVNRSQTPYLCDRCEECFSTLNQFKQHTKNAHGDDRLDNLHIDELRVEVCHYSSRSVDDAGFDDDDDWNFSSDSELPLELEALSEGGEIIPVLSKGKTTTASGPVANSPTASWSSTGSGTLRSSHHLNSDFTAGRCSSCSSSSSSDSEFEDSDECTVVAYPFNLNCELSNSRLVELCCDLVQFRVHYVQAEESLGQQSWVGLIELTLKSFTAANRTIASLQAAVKHLTVRCMDIGETPAKILKSLSVTPVSASSKNSPIASGTTLQHVT